MADSRTPDWLAAGHAHVWPPYARLGGEPPLPVVAAEGVRLRLADGRELIDGISSWWAACHGFGHPHIRAEVARQLDRLPHVMFAGLGHEPAYRLARRLAELLPGDLDRVFFVESGSVSVEVALKIALQHAALTGRPSRTRFVTMRGGYHGDTFATMALADPEEGMHARLASLLPRQIVADLPTDDGRAEALDRLLERHADEVAGLVVEPLVQGAGGMRFHDAAALRRLRAACDRHGILLIFDEIMTGFGRTGRLFACEEAGVVPDLVCLSKALTGGTLPLAATVARRSVAAPFHGDDPAAVLMHGPTYMANALACAAANASLDLFETEPRLRQVAAIEARLAEGLEPCRALPGVADVRVKGAIGVVQLDRAGDAPWLRARFVEEGCWVRPFGDVVYLMPPFVIGPDDLARLTDAVRRVVALRSERAAGR